MHGGPFCLVDIFFELLARIYFRFLRVLHFAYFYFPFAPICTVLAQSASGLSRLRLLEGMGHGILPERPRCPQLPPLVGSFETLFLEFSVLLRWHQFFCLLGVFADPGVDPL